MKSTLMREQSDIQFFLNLNSMTLDPFYYSSYNLTKFLDCFWHVKVKEDIFVDV